MKAIWNDTVIAESDNTIFLERNHYFPADSIKTEYFKSIDKTTMCPRKGTASYYDIEVDGETNEGAAWYYANPKDAANNIKGYVAFWKGVKVEE